VGVPSHLVAAGSRSALAAYPRHLGAAGYRPV